MSVSKAPHIFRDGSFESKVESSHISFRHYSRSEKPKKKIKHIILLHGAVEYHKRHMGLITALFDEYKNGVIVSAMDLVGHGYSGGARAYVDEFENFELDFLNFLKICGDLHHEFDVESSHIIAHSLGGLIAVRALVDRADELNINIDSLVLSNPCFKPLIKLPETAKKAVEMISNKAGKMRIPSMIGGKDLTSDPKRAMAFDGDRLISDFVTTGLVTAIYKACSQVMPYSYYLKVPTLFLVSGQDKVVNNEATELFIAGLDKNIVQALRYVDAKHDILNETCAEAVFQEIIDFINGKTNFDSDDLE